MALTRRRFLSTAWLLALAAALPRALRAAAAETAKTPALGKEEAIDALMKALPPLLGSPIDADHYREHFDWRWENVPGEAEKYAAAAGRLAQGASLPAEISDDVLLVFAETDAWTRAGYDYWPGEPAGLVDYLTPPRPRE